MRSFSRYAHFVRRFPDVTGVLALALVAAVVFWPLLTGQALFFGDLELYFYPLSEFWRRELVEGRLPLWNPHSFGGVSFAGNPQIGLLYPSNVLLMVLPAIPALMISIVLHLFGSGAIFFLWKRRGHLKLGVMASFLGALCWMLGGTFVSKAQFPNMLAALAWLPAILWSVEILAQRPTLRAATICGALFGLQLLAAHVQVSLYSSYLAFFYALWNWKQSQSALWKVASAFAFALMLAALLDGGQLIPVLENLRGAERQTLSLQTAPRFVLPIWALTNLFAPYLYGNPSNGTWTFHGGGNAWETACYLGVLPLFLALFAFKRGKFWSCAALLNLVLALGPIGGLYIVAFKFAPGIARFHDAARFLTLAGLSFSVLAALGLQKMASGAKTRRFVPLILLLSTLDLGLYARSFYPLRETSQIPPQQPCVGANDEFLKENQARLWMQSPKMARGLFINYADYRTRIAKNDAVFALGGIPNTQIWSGLLEAGGYDPIEPSVVAARLKSLEIAPDATKFPDNYAFNLGEDSIRFLSIWRAEPLEEAPWLPEIYRSAPTSAGLRLFVYRNELCAPRVRFETWPHGWSGAEISALTANSYRFVKFGPNRVQGLVIADNFSPSWSAFLGASELKIRPTPRGSMRLELPLAKPSASRNRDDVSGFFMVYQPQSFRFGVFLSLCGLSFVVAVLTATKNRKRNESLPVR